MRGFPLRVAYFCLKLFTMKKLIGLLFALSLLTSCTDAKTQRIWSRGTQFKIVLVNCNGTITHSWVSTGKVESSQTSDGYYFEDALTGSLVEVAGTVIISTYEGDSYTIKPS